MAAFIAKQMVGNQLSAVKGLHRIYLAYNLIPAIILNLKLSKFKRLYLSCKTMAKNILGFL